VSSHESNKTSLSIDGLVEMRKNRVQGITELNKFVIKGKIVFAGFSLCQMFQINELLNSEEKRYIVYNREISGDTTDGFI
jgi:hypothetical protein